MNENEKNSQDSVPPGKKKKSDEIYERKFFNDENNEKNSQQKNSHHPLSPSVDAPFPEIYEILTRGVPEKGSFGISGIIKSMPLEIVTGI